MGLDRRLLRAVLGALLLGVSGAAVALADEHSPTPAALTVQIALTTPSPSNSGSLTFELTFSAAVTGLAAADLRLGGTAAGCTIGDPTGAEAAYAVSVTGCGDGTVSLTLAALSVVDAEGNPGPAEAVSGPAGTIDTLAPEVAVFAATSAGPVAGNTITYDLVFGEAVTGLGAADFSTAGTSTGWSVSAISGSATTYLVTLSRSAGGNGSVSLRLAANAVVDGAGNAGPPAQVSAPSVSVQALEASASVVINGGAASTSDPRLRLTLSAASFGANLRMRFSLDGGTSWTTFEPFATSRDLDLPAKQRWGTLTVAVQFRDDAGTSLSRAASIGYTQAPRSHMALRAQYVLTSSLDYASARLSTRQVVEVTNSSGVVIGHLDFSVLARYYGEMTVGAVSVDDRSVAPLYPNAASMRLPLGFNLRGGESVRVVINFGSLAKPSVSDYLRSRLAKANGLMQVSSWHPLLSDGHGLRHPGDSQYSVAADFRLELTHPKAVRIAAPGNLVSSTATTKVYTLANAREYAFAASPNFLASSATTAGGVKVTVYHLANTSGVATARKVAVRSLDTFSTKLGKYPYKQFVVALGARPSVGLEYSGIVFVGSSLMGSKYVIAHEVAHQWWYGIVGNDQLADPWLDEAFAEFSGRYFLGGAMPAYCSTRVVNSSIYDFPNSPGTGTCNGYTQTVYRKGASFLDGVRARMGTTAFVNALRAIVAENRYRVVTTADVRATFLRYATNKSALDSYMKSFLR